MHFQGINTNAIFPISCRPQDLLKTFIGFPHFGPAETYPGQCLPHVSFAKIHHAVKGSPQWAKHGVQLVRRQGEERTVRSLGWSWNLRIHVIPRQTDWGTWETHAIEIYTPLLWGDRIWRCLNELWWGHAPQPSEQLCAFASDKHVSESFLNNGWMVQSHLMMHSHQTWCSRCRI